MPNSVNVEGFAVNMDTFINGLPTVDELADGLEDFDTFAAGLLTVDELADVLGLL